MDMITGMELSTGSRCIKYLLFLFNLVFLITGFILLPIGAVILRAYYNYPLFLDEKFFSAPSLLISIGTIIFFITLFGCCGAIRESYCMIVMFATLMVLIFILELAAGISGYVLRDRANEVIENRMNNTMKLYNQSLEVAYFWDALHQDFHCCGTIDPQDWKNITGFDGLPMTCCRTPVGAIGSLSCNNNSLNLYNQGCLTRFQTFIRTHAVQLGGVGIGLAVVQGIGIFFAIYLARSIKHLYQNV